MNYEDFRTRYLTDLNNIASTTTYSLEETSNEISHGRSNSGSLRWDNLSITPVDWESLTSTSQTATIETNTTIDRDLWDRLTTNTARSIEFEPLDLYGNVRGRRAQHISFDDSMWREGFTFTFEEATPLEEDAPLEQITDGDLEELL